MSIMETLILVSWIIAVVAVIGFIAFFLKSRKKGAAGKGSSPAPSVTEETEKEGEEK